MEYTLTVSDDALLEEQFAAGALAAVGETDLSLLPPPPPPPQPLLDGAQAAGGSDIAAGVAAFCIPGAGLHLGGAARMHGVHHGCG